MPSSSSDFFGELTQNRERVDPRQAVGSRGQLTMLDRPESAEMRQDGNRLPCSCFSWYSWRASVCRMWTPLGVVRAGGGTR